MKRSARSNKARETMAEARARVHAWPPMPTYCSFGALVMSGVLTLANPALAQRPGTPLPADALPVALRDKSGALLGAKGVSGIRYSNNLLEVDQSTARAIMNWRQFNVGSAAEVRFNQKSTSDSILNRIYDNDPSIIQGRVTCVGQCVFINRNGILFDQGSQINVGSLIASTLNMKDQDFLDGFAKGASRSTAEKSKFTQFSDTWEGVGAAPDDDPKLNPVWLDENGNPKVAKSKPFQMDANGNATTPDSTRPGSIAVNLYGPGSDKAGKLTNAATLSAAPGGSIILIAPQIQNRGVIVAPDGQVILAAGEKAYLWVRNTDAGDAKAAALRGLMVEISASKRALNITSYIRNLGTISADRGNVTLAGLTIKQDGRVTAGSSAVLNGSVWLTARSIKEPGVGVTGLSDKDDAGLRELDGQRGEVSFGSGSYTGTPLLTDSGRLAESASYSKFSTTTTDNGVTTSATRDYRSWIHVVAAGEDGSSNGGRIHNQGTVEAPGGTIDFYALGQGSRILLDQGSVVSAAGDWVTRQMSDNVITIPRLTSNDLKDSPVAKAGPLLLASVSVDMRKGSPLFDVSAYSNNLQRTVQDKATVGGDILLEARGGDVIGLAGSKLDVSGGGFRYESGNYRTSKLLGADGKVYDISDASPLRSYTAVGGGINRTYFKAGPMGWKQTVSWATRLGGKSVFESAYVQGADAGSLTIIAPQVVPPGDWVGGITAGRYQVNATESTAFPKGGSLIIGDASIQDAVVNTISFDNSTRLANDFGIDTPLDSSTASKGVVLAADQYRPASVQRETYSYKGFSSLDLHANQSIQVSAGTEIALPPGGSFKATGASAQNNTRIVLEAAHDGLAGGAITVPAGTVSLTAKSVSIGGAQYGADGSVKTAGASINTSGAVMADARPADGIAAGGGFAAKSGSDLNAYVKNNLGALLDDMSAPGKEVKDGAVVAPAFAVNAVSAENPLAKPDDPTKKITTAISLDAGNSLTLGKGASLAAMGGLKLGADNSVAVGNGGDISLTGLSLPSGAAAGSAPQALGVELNSYALGKGGKLSIDTNSVKVTNATGGAAMAADPATGGLLLNPSFFRKGGFTSYALTGQQGMNIAAGTVLQPMARGLEVKAIRLAPREGAQTSGFDADIAAAGAQGVNATAAGSGAGSLALDVRLREKAAGERAPTNLSFALAKNAAGSDLVFGEGAEIRTDPLASVSFKADVADVLTAGLSLLGKIYAPGGTISATLTGGRPATSSSGYNPADPDADGQYSTLRIGQDAELNTAGTFIAEVGGSDAFGFTRDDSGAIALRARNLGTLTSGGTISLEAKSGSVVAEAGSVLDVSAAGATVDAAEDVRGRVYAPKAIWGDAGSIDIKSQEATRIKSVIRAGAKGDGLGGSFSLSFTRRSPDGAEAQALRPDDDHRLVLTQGAVDAILRSAASGSPYVTSRISADSLNAAGLSSVSLRSDQSIEFSGDVALNAAQSLKVDAPIVEARSAPGTADTTHVVLNADRVMLTNTTGVPSKTNPAVPSTSLATGLGNATLEVDARVIDVVGSVTVNGLQSGRAGATETAPLLLNSRSDIRLTGLPVKQGTTSNSTQITDSLVGGLTSESNIELRAQQIYPTTLSQFTVASAQVASDGATATLIGSVRVTRNAGEAQQVLSAGGKLVLSGDKVIQGGTVKAPLGRIELNGREVQLAAGSLTSVSLDGATVPLGETTDAGRTWFYRLGQGQDYNKDTSITLTSPGEKQIVAKGDSVAIDRGAVVDLSGGGDVQAFEFIPGPGGSKDVLQTTASAQTWAILPGTRLSDAPVDSSLSARNSTSTAVTGSPYNKIYISGAAGLADGWYPLLDAHYALLPGAYQVAAVSDAKFSNLPLGKVGSLLDGTSVISAYLGVAGSRAHQSDTAGYVVRTGSAARAYSEFKLSNSDFFAAQASSKDLATPRLPLDAGGLTLAPLRNLSFAGMLKSKPASGGRAAEIDISSELLAVTDEPAGSTATPQYLNDALADLQSRGVVGSDAHFVQVSAQALAELDGSLLLGGSRSSDGKLDTAAKQVVVANSSATALKAAEVMLAARDKIDVRSGAVIDGTQPGALTRTALSTEGDGAFLRAASGDQLTLARSNVTRAGGVLDVHSGASVSGKSIVLDSTKTTRLSGTLNQPAGGALSLASGAVALGQAPAGLSDTLVLDQSKLDALGTLDEVVIRSYSSIDLHGNVDVGSRDLKALTLDAREIAGFRARDAQGQVVGQANQASLTAQALTLRNQGATDLAASTPDGDGTLKLQAERLVLGAGDKGIRGYSSVTATADVEVAQAGKGTTTVAGEFNLVTPRIVTSARADQTLRAQNYAGDQQFALNVSQPAAQAAARLLPTAAGAGGRWGFEGSKISFATTLDAPSSVIEMAAHGTQPADDVLIGTGANIKVNGYTKQFTDAAAYASAGSVTLVADAGNVSIADGASIDFSAASGGGDAGKLSISASKGSATVAGNVLGAAGVGESGKIAIDAASLNDFTQINARLNEGKVEGERVFRQRQGDFQAATDSSVKARHVSITADEGRIALQGKIDASSANGGGRVELYAKNDVTLGANSLIDASGTSTGTAATDAYANGGTVDITAGRDLSFDTASTIDISAGAKGDAGRLIFAVNRNADGSLAHTLDLKGTVAAQAGANGKAGQVIVRGDASYQMASIDASVTTPDETNGIWRDYRDFMQSASALKDRLKINQDGGLKIVDRLGNAISDASPSVRAGIEIRSPDSTANNPGPTDLKLDSDWDLTAGSADGTGWNIGGVPGTVTLRASGNLDISHQLGLVDGDVTDAAGNAVASDRLPQGESWSLRLASGADTSSANPLAMASKTVLATANTGDLTVRDDGDGSGQIGKIRTGSGAIDIAAGRDLIIGSTSGDHAVIYSAGRPVDTFNPTSNETEAVARYTESGGDIRIAVQGNAIGTLRGASGSNGAYINDWLRRTSLQDFAGGVAIENGSASWWAYRPYFRGGVGSFGGGEVTLAVAGDISNLGVYSATSGRASWEINDGTEIRTTDLVVRGGGDVRVSAGGNIDGAEYLVSLGRATVRAGNDIGDTTPIGTYVMGQGSDAARSGASLRIEGGGDVHVQNVSNPTIMRPAGAGLVGGSDLGPDPNFAFDRGLPSNTPVYGFGLTKSGFFTYAPSSSAEIVSVAGDTSVGRTAAATVDGKNDFSQVVPPRYLLAALNGNVSQTYKAIESTNFAQSSIELYSSAQGSASVLASGNVSGLNLLALNIDSTKLPVAVHPAFVDGSTGVVEKGGNETVPVGADRYVNLYTPRQFLRSTTPLAAVGERAFVVEAKNGDLTQDRLVFPDSASIRAGRDILGSSIELQNLNSGAESMVVAGRDISLNSTDALGTIVFAADHLGIRVAGQGSALIQAGRNIDLGDVLSDGILADGNSRNSSLASAKSARLIVISGVKGKVDVATVDALMPAVKLFGVLGDGNSAAMAREVSVEIAAARAASDQDAALTRLDDALAALASSGKTAPIRTAAGAARDALAAARKAVAAGQPQTLIDRLLSGLGQMAVVNTFDGGAVTAASTAAAEGVVSAAFAGNSVSAGDINLFSTRIRTTGGSDIDLLAPGFDAQGRPAGNINAGLPSGGSGDTGITTLGGGAIRAFLSGDFNVNRSKVLTAQTGDIMLYSSDGSIDAGRGATTSVSTSPPRRVAVTDSDGNVVGFTYLSPTDVAGSGIRTASSDPDGAGPQTTPKPGSIFLFAPKGTIDAGEAGIDSAGDVTIRAVTVLNANSISAAGSSNGVPPPDTGGLGALATATNPTSSNNKQADEAGNSLAAKNTTGQNSLKPTIIIVEVLGFGDDGEEKNRKR